jgi:hypothetical protein
MCACQSAFHVPLYRNAHLQAEVARLQKAVQAKKQELAKVVSRCKPHAAAQRVTVLQLSASEISASSRMKGATTPFRPHRAAT